MRFGSDYTKEKTLLQDMVQSMEPLPIDELSSPLNAQILEFCESELFKETLQESEVGSNSNCCYEENSSYPTNQEMNQYANTLLLKDDPPETTSTTLTSSAQAAINNNNNVVVSIKADPTTIKNNNNNNIQGNYSVIFDSPDGNENDISVSIDFNNSAGFPVVPSYLNNQQQQNQFDYSALSNSNQLTDHVTDASLTTQYPSDLPIVPLMGVPSLPPVFEEECLSALPPHTRFNTSTPSSCSLLDPTLGPYLPAGSLSAALTAVDNPGILSGGGGGGALFLGTEVLPPPQDLDFQGDSGGIFCPDTMQRVYNCTSELQAICNESQHLVNSAANSAPLGPEISSLEDPSFKVGKLTVEERREKIHRYMKKRNERNFSKKIKYACRKTLADSRPRVRGRFAKNDEHEMPRTNGCISNHEEDTDEDAVVKEEDDMVDSSDIFAHISGVNSFKCSNPLHSWI